MGKKGVLIGTMIAGIAVMLALSSIPAYAVHGGNSVQIYKTCDSFGCDLFKDANDNGKCGVITELIAETKGIGKFKGIPDCPDFEV